MSMSENINELISALSKAQAEIQVANLDAENTYFNSPYATLASVWAACRKPLTDNNLAVIQTIAETENGPMLNTKLMHSSGQWIDSDIFLRAKRNDPQGIGSALTYARRYALAAIAGVSPADDDGNQGTKGPEEASSKIQLVGAEKKLPNGNSIRPALQPKELLDILKRAIELNSLKDKATGESLPISLLAIHKAPAVISSKFQEALGGDEEKYRNCLEWLFDVRTANDLTAAQGSALLDWLLGKGTDKKFDTPIKEPASIEAERIVMEIVQKENS